jgi:hypothetical protein
VAFAPFIILFDSFTIYPSFGPYVPSSAAPAKHCSLRHDALRAELQSLAHSVGALVARVKKAYSPIMRKVVLLLRCFEKTDAAQ